MAFTGRRSLDVKGAERRDDHEIREDKGPTSGPRTPESGTQVRNIDADLDGERSRQGLADRDRFAHLLFGQPFALGHKLALHLTDKRHRSAEPEQAETQKISDDLADSAVRRCCCNGHPSLLRSPINPNTSVRFARGGEM